MKLLLASLLSCMLVWSAVGFQIQLRTTRLQLVRSATSTSVPRTRLYLDQKEDIQKDADSEDETVKKYGLEAGLYKSVTDKESKLKPKDLLAKYGIAYLATSITLAIISYAFFYVLVANGVDVPSLLDKVGISATTAATNTGTAAIAYALHKAASPIRFPPTVLLTPVVANLLGKKTAEGEQKEADKK